MIILVIHYGNTEVEPHHEPIWNRHGIDISPRKVLRLTDRNNDELAIEREMLPMIVMWMSPGNETGTGDAFTVTRWIGELRLVPTNINRVLVIINKNVDIKLMCTARCWNKIYHQLNLVFRRFVLSP